jgi:hypothetical protein
MSTTRRAIIVSAVIKDEINSRLHSVEGVDFRGGGDLSFGSLKLQLLTSAPLVVDAYGANWRLEDEQWVLLRALLPPDGPVSDPVTHTVWKRNSSDPDTLISWYDVGAPWTLQGILDDQTRKPKKLRLLED